jgi:hypothetical protein
MFTIQLRALGLVPSILSAGVHLRLTVELGLVSPESRNVIVSCVSSAVRLHAVAARLIPSDRRRCDW